MRSLLLRLIRYLWRWEVFAYGVIGVWEVVIGFYMVRLLIDELSIHRDVTYFLIKFLLLEAAFILNYRVAWMRSGTIAEDWRKFHKYKLYVLAGDWFAVMALGWIGFSGFDSAAITFIPCVLISWRLNERKVFVSARRAPS